MDTKQSSEKRFALLIDADNVSAKYIKPITDELSKYGTVTYKRIYGDWTLTLHAKWKDALLENSITPIQQFGYTQGKNATDSAMIIDAMDILYTRSVEGFCIVSSDSDFTRLASRIRESGLTVIGMGEKKTPTPFRKACDIFTTLELLLGDTGSKSSGGRGKSRHDQPGSSSSQSAGTTTMSKDEIEQAVVNIITDNQNNGKSTGLGEVGSRLLKRYPDFDVRSYGTNLLSKLLDEFASVQIIKDGSSVAVVLTEGKDAKDAPVEVEQAPEGTQGDGSEDASGAEQTEPTDAQGAAEAKPAEKKPAPRRQPRRRKEQAPEAVEQEPAEAADPAVESAEGQAVVPVEAEPVERPSLDNRPGRAARKRVAATRAKGSGSKKPAAGNQVEKADRAGEADVQALAPSEEQKPAAKPKRKPARAKAPKAERPVVDAEAAKEASVDEAAPASASAKRPAKRSVKATSKAPASNPAAPSDAEAFIRQTVADAEPEGIALSVLGKRVRGKFRSFKLRDLGYAQFRPYLADLAGIKVEQRDGQSYARLDR